jgi:VanZ family protein
VISTILVENAALVHILFWAAVAVSAILGWVLFRSGKAGALAVLAVIGLLGVLALTVSPSDGVRYAFCAVQFSVPFQGIDTLANIAMMVPLTLFATLRLRRPLLVFAATTGLSAVIELAQALILTLGRSCDTNDWFMNTVGAAAGTLIACTIIVVDGRYRRQPIATSN